MRLMWGIKALNLHGRRSPGCRTKGGRPQGWKRGALAVAPANSSLLCLARVKRAALFLCAIGLLLTEGNTPTPAQAVMFWLLTWAVLALS